MKKILLYIFIVVVSIFMILCNDYLDCEFIIFVSINVYFYFEIDLVVYVVKFYNDSENENNGEYGNIFLFYGFVIYNLGLF